MIVELMMIGNEILIGKTKDTNSNWMAKRITKYGHKIRRITVIEDDLGIIANTLREVLERGPDLIVASGGLGPTFDDMTLEGIAKGLNKELKLNRHAYESIKTAYKQAHRTGILKLEGMTKEREKMAFLPEGSTPLPNARGTAPGVKLVHKDTTIFCLPGVPMEMKWMFNNIIVPILKETRGKFIERSFIFGGIGESQIAPYTTRVENKYPKLWIKTHPRLGEYLAEIEVSITAFNVENGEDLADKALSEIKDTVLKLNGKIIKE